MRDRGVSITSAVAHRVRSYKGRAIFCCDVPRSGASLHDPLCGGEGWTIRPRRGARQDVGHFSSWQEPGRKARPPLTDWLGNAQTAPRGCLSLWLLSFGQARESNPGRSSGSEARRPTGTPFGCRRATLRWPQSRLEALGNSLAHPFGRCSLSVTPERWTVKTEAKGCRAQGALLQRERLGAARGACMALAQTVHTA